VLRGQANIFEENAMSDANQTNTPNDIDNARITDEDIERERAQIGVSQFEHGECFNRLVSDDGIRHFAFGFVADENPLWHEPDYGAKTRWRGQIAPPLFPTTTGINETPKYDTPEMKALFKGLYRGVGRYNVGTNWKLFRPIRPGDVIYHDTAVSNVQVKENSSFSGARTVLDTIRHLYVDRDGRPVAVRCENFINAERGGSREVGKHANTQRHVYTDEEIARIDGVYAAEEIRGAEPRWWEDVNPGDSIVPVVKGPLGTLDIIAGHLGWGLSGTYGAGPFRYDWKTRQKLSAFYSKDRYGVPQTMMRVHWEQERAAELGLPAPYDYGQMRSNWMAHAITNWMGDDAWIATLDTEIRGFNFHGDTTFITGTVVSKNDADDICSVELVIIGTNQRDEITCKAYGKIRLPSRTKGAVVLPFPDADICARGADLMATAARRLNSRT
jgi:acyl dehydratase